MVSLVGDTWTFSGCPVGRMALGVSLMWSCCVVACDFRWFCLNLSLHFMWDCTPCVGLGGEGSWCDFSETGLPHVGGAQAPVAGRLGENPNCKGCNSVEERKEQCRT